MKASSREPINSHVPLVYRLERAHKDSPKDSCNNCVDRQEAQYGKCSFCSAEKWRLRAPTLFHGAPKGWREKITPAKHPVHQYIDADDDAHDHAEYGEHCACALTVKLRDRTTIPARRRGRTLSPGARGAQPQTHHGPLQRLLGAFTVNACELDGLHFVPGHGDSQKQIALL
jgi:hypothetical protein